jgi:predicted dehydrogenase
MGKRRIRLLKQGWPGIEVVGVDSREDRRNAAADTLKIEAFESIADALGNAAMDAAFVCTAPASHSGIIEFCLTAGLHVFTELNLIADKYSELVELADRKGKTLFLSSTLLYRHDIRQIAARVKGQQVNYIYHVGQYLPDWHPWEDYKSFFVGSRLTNACREIFAIDLPWMIDAFGSVARFSVVHDKSSDLDLEYDDNYMVTFRHENGNKGVFCVDVVARKPVRRLEVYSENLHIFWDGTPLSLQEYDLEEKVIKTVQTYDKIEKNPAYSDNIIENAYADEIESFFNTVEGKTLPLHSFARDAKILSLIDEIEGSAG